MIRINKLFLTSLIVAQIIMFTPSPSLSTPNFYAQGLQAEFAGDFTQAIEHYEKAASDGLSDAKFALGRIYKETYADDENSFKWFTEAAKQGNSFAQYELGLTYLSGNASVTPDTEEANKWLSLAVSRGKHGEAAYELFKLTATDSEKQSWLLKAAEYGVLQAKETLSEAYKTGAYGLNIDSSKANYWQDEASRMRGDS